MEEIKEVNEKKKMSSLKKIIIIILVLGIGLGCYMHFIEPHIIVIQDYLINNNKIPKSFDGFTIVQFSDIHFGRTINEKEVEKVVQKINDCNADIVIFSGDLFDSYITLSEANVEFLKATLANIKAKMKKYAIFGDQDYINEDYFKEIMNSCGFELLNGENKKIFYEGNTPIYITGGNTISKGLFDVDKAISKDTDGFQILVTHEPMVINKADVIISGHSLGGLIRLPFIGGLVKFENTNGYEKGLYKIDNTSLYVSGGIGTQSVSLRFANFPEINCYRLVSK